MVFSSSSFAGTPQQAPEGAERWKKASSCISILLFLVRCTGNRRFPMTLIGEVLAGRRHPLHAEVTLKMGLDFGARSRFADLLEMVQHRPEDSLRPRCPALSTSTCARGVAAYRIQRVV